MFEEYREYFLVRLIENAACNINDARWAVGVMRGLWDEMSVGR
jgi:hypothetical protein